VLPLRARVPERVLLAQPPPVLLARAVLVLPQAPVQAQRPERAQPPTLERRLSEASRSLPASPLPSAPPRLRLLRPWGLGPVLSSLRP
jgi:hypothetical protein